MTSFNTIVLMVCILQLLTWSSVHIHTEESPEMASVKTADSSQTLGLNVIINKEEKEDIGESVDHGKSRF